MTGDFEALNKMPYPYSLVCYSLRGVLIHIDKNHFIANVLANAFQNRGIRAKKFRNKQRHLITKTGTYQEELRGCKQMSNQNWYNVNGTSHTSKRSHSILKNR